MSRVCLCFVVVSACVVQGQGNVLQSKVHHTWDMFLLAGSTNANFRRQSWYKPSVNPPRPHPGFLNHHVVWLVLEVIHLDLTENLYKPTFALI